MCLNNGISKKHLLNIAFFILSIVFASAQENKSVFWNHIRFGGNLGLDISDRFFSATVAPSGIYQFDNTFALGLGINATFNNQKSFYKSTIFGGSIIGLINVINEIQLSAEFEQLNVDRNYNVNLNIEDQNYWVPALFLGAGYRQGNITFGVKYDLLYNEEQSIYLNSWLPFVRFYF